jgi:hypothetical protein
MQRKFERKVAVSVDALTRLSGQALQASKARLPPSAPMTVTFNFRVG